MLMSKTAHPLDNPKIQLQVRNATQEDIPQIAALSTRVYSGTGMHGHSAARATVFCATCRSVARKCC